MFALLISISKAKSAICILFLHYIRMIEYSFARVKEFLSIQAVALWGSVVFNPAGSRKKAPPE
jgi:hypothetical protein